MTINIKDGRYSAKVVCWGFTKTDKGADQFAIEFDVDADGPEYAPTKLTHFIGLQSDKSLEIFDKHLAACGWKGTDYNAIELDTNTPVSLNIQNDDYGPKVKFIDPVGGAGGLIERKRMSERDQASLVAKLNARAKSRPATGAPAGTPAPTQARPAAAASAPQKPAAPRPTAAAKPPAPKAAPAPADENSDWGLDGDDSGAIPF